MAALHGVCSASGTSAASPVCWGGVGDFSIEARCNQSKLAAVSLVLVSLWHR